VALGDDLKRMVKWVSSLRVSRDPASYSRYRFDRRERLGRAARGRQHDKDRTERTRADAERDHDFEARYDREEEGRSEGP
jgi:hypothetical protein